MGGSAKKIGILIVGSVVVLAGIALLALPGPGMIVIIVGLVILAQEFDWAQRLLDIAVERAAGATTKLQESTSGKLALGASGLGLIAAGIVIIVVWSQYIVVGISLIVAGIIGLCTLLPQVSAWIEEKSITGLDDTDDVS